MRHYLDWASTALPYETTRDLTFYANPSSSHSEGRAAKEALEKSRERCAKVLGVKAEQLYFTSGGTESNSLVLHSLLLKKGSSQLLYSGIEHPSVRENCLRLKRLGLPTGEIGVEGSGQVTESTLRKALEKHKDTRFVAVMGVNNETGSLMDIKSLVSAARKTQSENGPSIHFHCDLVQALGKTPVDISAWDIDSGAFSAHKLGGSRGVGLLYLKKPIEALYAGGEQEGRIRPGTENVHGAVELASLLEKRANAETVKAEAEKAQTRLDYFIAGLKKINRASIIPEDRNEADKRFSPWIIQIRIKDLPAMVMVRALDDMGIAVSTGSACSSSSPERPVLAAMGVKASSRLEGLRISQGWSTELVDFDALLSGIEKALLSL